MIAEQSVMPSTFGCDDGCGHHCVEITKSSECVLRLCAEISTLGETQIRSVDQIQECAEIGYSLKNTNSLYGTNTRHVKNNTPWKSQNPQSAY